MITPANTRRSRYSVMGAPRDRRDLDRCILESIAHVFDERNAAIQLATDAGIPRSRIPTFTTPMAFWSSVLVELDKGLIPNGIDSVLSAALRAYPCNESFHFYIERLSATPSNELPVHPSKSQHRALPIVSPNPTTISFPMLSMSPVLTMAIVVATSAASSFATLTVMKYRFQPNTARRPRVVSVPRDTPGGDRRIEAPPSTGTPREQPAVSNEPNTASPTPPRDTPQPDTINPASPPARKRTSARRATRRRTRWFRSVDIHHTPVSDSCYKTSCVALQDDRMAAEDIGKSILSGCRLPRNTTVTIKWAIDKDGQASDLTVFPATATNRCITAIIYEQNFLSPGERRVGPTITLRSYDLAR